MKETNPYEFSLFSDTLLKALDNTGQGLALVDMKSHQILNVNVALCRILGYSSPEFLSFPNYLSLVSPDTQGPFQEWLRVSSGTEFSPKYDVLFNHKNGTRIPVEVMTCRLPESFKSRPILFLVRDISEEKRANDQLKLFQTLTLAVNEAKDFESALAVVLRKVCLSTGWEYGEAWIPCPINECLKLSGASYGADHQMDALRKLRQNITFEWGEGLPGRAWSSKQPQWVDNIELDKGIGGDKNFLLSAGLQTAMAIPAIAHNNVVVVLVFFVSAKNANKDLFVGLASVVAPQLGSLFQRKKIEEELHESNIFLDSVIENIPDMVFIKDAKDLKFVRFNKAGEQLLGISRDKMIGKSDYDFFPKEEADFFTAKDMMVLDQGHLVDIAGEPIHTQKGLRILHTKKIPILDENKKPLYLLGISEDITDKKKGELG